MHLLQRLAMLKALHPSGAVLRKHNTNKDGRVNMDTHSSDERPIIYKVDEVASILRICIGTLRTLLQDGTIASIRTGRNYRITAKALQEYLNGN